MYDPNNKNRMEFLLYEYTFLFPFREENECLLCIHLFRNTCRMGNKKDNFLYLCIHLIPSCTGLPMLDQSIFIEFPAAHKDFVDEVENPKNTSKEKPLQGSQT
jgi:hypothetical protein